MNSFMARLQAMPTMKLMLAGLVLPIIVIGVLFAPRPAAPRAPQPTPTIEGVGSQNSKPFELSGDYTVTITGTATGPYGGNVIVHLNRKDGTDWQGLWSEIVPNQQDRYSYSTQAYSVKDGLYYLDAITPGGAWTVTFTPQ